MPKSLQMYNIFSKISLVTVCVKNAINNRDIINLFTSTELDMCLELRKFSKYHNMDLKDLRVVEAKKASNNKG